MPYRPGRIGLQIPFNELLEGGAIPTQDISSVTGPLPGDPGFDTGYGGMLGQGIKEGLGGPIVGLAERLRLLPPGARARVRQEFEEARLAFLSGNPGPMRALWAGLSEVGPSAVPYLPAAGAGAVAKGLGVGAAKLPGIVRGAAAAEGALVGLGETAGMGPEATALGVGLGVGAGALAGGIGGRTYLDFAERDVGATRKWFQRWFTGDRGLPKGVMQLERGKVGKFQEVMASVEARIRDMKKAMLHFEKAPGGMTLADSKTALHEALTHKGGIDKLPQELRGPAQAMRDDMDKWSGLIRDSDMVPEDVKKTILENMSQYHHFSHEAFDNPIFTQLATSPERMETWNAALDLLKREMPGAGTPELEGLMLTMVDRNPELMKFMARGGFRLPQLPFLKKRKDIDPKMRDLMGYYEDPFINYQKSVAFMSADLTAHQTLKEQRALLLQMPEVKDHLSKIGGNPDNWHYYQLRGFPGRDPFTKAGALTGRDVPIVSVGDKVRISSRHNPGIVTNIDPMAHPNKKVTVAFGNEKRSYPISKIHDEKGRPMYMPGAKKRTLPVQTDEGVSPLYATKDFWEFWERSNEVSRMTVLPMLNLMTHAAKTALSPQTHFRNFLSGTAMVSLQGHLPFSKETGEIAKAAFGQPFAINKSEFMDDANFLLRRGVLGSSVHEGDLKAYIENATMMMTRGKVGKARQALISKLQKGGDVAGRIYVAEDNFWKTFLFRKEMNRYMDVGGLSRDAARDMAAEVVEETMQIYSRIPLAIKKVRDFPLVGPFVSFPSEIVRNLKNTGKRALIEMGSEHPGIRKIGQRRLSGMFATTTLIPAAAAMTGRAWTGTDKGQESSLREFLAPWTANSQFLLTGAEEGQWDYFDMSFMDPYNYAKKPVISMVRNFSTPDINGYEALWETAKEATQPWLGSEIILGEALKLKRTLEHRSQESPAWKAGQAAQATYRAFAPGFVTTGERITRSLNIPGIRNYLPAQSKYGRTLKPVPEIAALIGPRFTTVNVKEGFRFRARDFSRGKGEAHAIWGEEAKAEGRGPVKKLQAKQRAQAVYENAGEEILRKIEAARNLGVSDEDMIKMLMDLNISKKDSRQLVLSGEVPRLRLRDPV